MRLEPPPSYRTGEDPDVDEEYGRRVPSAAADRPVRARMPRRAALQVKRVDPWSVLKLAVVLGVALFLVWMFAVGVLYAILDGMGVWDKLNGTFSELTPGSTTSGPLISAGGVFGVAALVGLINTILFIALTSVAAFIYNVSADLTGGVAVTLSELD